MLVTYKMNDNKREFILKKVAHGYLACVFMLLLLTMTMGKEYGRFFLLTVIFLYSLFYVVIYNYICRGFDEDIRRMNAFGNMARGTLVGVIYYTSMLISFIIIYLYLSVFLD